MFYLLFFLYCTIIFMIFKHIFAPNSYEQNKSGCCVFNYLIMKFFFYCILLNIM